MPQIKNLAVVVFAAPEAAEAARQATHGRSWPDNGVRNSLRPRCAPPPGPGRPPGSFRPRARAPLPRRKRICCGCARTYLPASGAERAAGVLASRTRPGALRGVERCGPRRRAQVHSGEGGAAHLRDREAGRARAGQGGAGRRAGGRGHGARRGAGARCGRGGDRQRRGRARQGAARRRASDTLF